MTPLRPATTLPSDELRQLFDASAPIYNRVDALGLFGTGLRYRRDALGRAGLKSGMQVIDVACGTGLMSLAAWRQTEGDLKIIGVDPSPGMLAQIPAKLPLEIRQGLAGALPVADASGDFLMMGYALRHLTDWEKAFSDFARVLRPGGRLLILEITRPRTCVGRAFFHTYFGGFLPALGCVATLRWQAWLLYRYYWRSMALARPPAAVVKTLAEAGFTAIAHNLHVGCLSEFTAVRP